jgi:hypothetical protein
VLWTDAPGLTASAATSCAYLNCFFDGAFGSANYQQTSSSGPPPPSAGLDFYDHFQRAVPIVWTTPLAIPLV